MRLFIATPLTARVKEILAECNGRIRGIKWQTEAQMHLTLRFLGETSDERLADLKPRLEKIQQSAFSLHIKGSGIFPNMRSPRILWAGVEKTEPLRKLQKKVEKQCRAVGFEAEKRSFHPHITLGRVNETASARQVRAFIEGTKMNQLDLSMPVSAFCLYRSKLRKECAVHTVLETYQLQAEQNDQ